ncbi:hypothetical protein SAMN05421780_107114 [Flexibacter flexilis DSM 6793]|uniref:EpsG family protein n=1 Tax=Flexibacter flexilis DSM 6793 TaxID=927664 RepID=A0A1I1KLG5_9BACT|nr:hypothetical protein [Flexibacter flexilis]SFC61521.1 hypothetical protein SAMN05421780_107114 [Flexibacter flexilis DSM 6793]
MKAQKSYLIILFLSLVFTISKAFRLPNDFAEAHWLIGYQFGFIKRALPGAFLNVLFPSGENMESKIIFISIILFLIFCAALFFLAYKIIKLSDFYFDDYVILLSFFSSSYIVFSAHFMGYYDNILILIVILSFLLISRNYLIFASMVLALGILTHESSLIMCLPLATFYVMIKFRDDDIKKKIQSFFELLIIPIVVFLLIYISNKNSSISMEVLQNHLQKFDFIKENRDFIVADGFTHSFLDYINEQRIYFWARIFEPTLIFKVGLPLFVIIWLSWEKIEKNKTNIILYSIYVLICILPLGLHAIAWDTGRIWGYTQIIAFLGYFLMRSQNLLKLQYQKAEIIIILLLIGIENLIMYTPLMDNLTEKFDMETRIIFFITVIAFVIINRFNITQKEEVCN